MRTLTLALFLFVTLLSGTCTKDKKAAGSTQPKYTKNDTVQLKKYKCRGNCAVYEMTVSGDGTAILKGEEHISLIGTFKKEIGKERATQLLEKMRILIPILKDEYLPTISDYHIIEVSASILGQQKKVKCKHNAPEDFVSLINDLEAIVEAGGWVAL